MSYRAFKRLLGETSLERKCRFLFGTATLLLITASFYWYARQTEDLAYNLKVRGRAVLVGETTRGGAHPTAYYPVTEHVSVTVPYARSINPVTGGDWEGVGIQPDLAVPAADALDVAYQHALKKLPPRPAPLAK